MTASQPRLRGITGWPPALAERYRARGYWAGVTFGAMVDVWAAEYGDRIAVSDEHERLTYADLAQRSRRLAGHLRDLGIHCDDRIVVQLPNTIAFCDLLLALLRIGALPVMALPAHREYELGHMIDHTEAVGLAVPLRFGNHDHLAMAIGLRDTHDTLAHLLVAGDPRDGDGAVDLTSLVHRQPVGRQPATGPMSHDVALFLLSGGTTGLPKLIPRTHDDYAYNARASAELCGFDAGTVYLAALPISHNFPLACPGILGTWMVGGRVVLTDNANPPGVFDLIERERVTATALVPTLAGRWIESPDRVRRDLSSLTLVQVGGARLAPEIARRLEPALGVTLQQVFGMAEGLLNYTRLDDPAEVRQTTQGRPLSPDDQIMIVDQAGQEVTAGQEGELLTCGPYTLRGYYRAVEHNARAFTADGFYQTGDIVLLDPSSGNLVVLGRSKDLINRGGEKVSAEEIENLALAHPAVLEVAAVAMPDEDLGERTCLYIVPRSGHIVTLDEMCSFLRGRRMARYKLPERIELRARLPLTAVGKIDKRALRDDIRARLDQERERSDKLWAR